MISPHSDPPSCRVLFGFLIFDFSILPRPSVVPFVRLSAILCKGFGSPRSPDDSLIGFSTGCNFLFDNDGLLPLPASPSCLSSVVQPRDRERWRIELGSFFCRLRIPSSVWDPLEILFLSSYLRHRMGGRTDTVFTYLWTMFLCPEKDTFYAAGVDDAHLKAHHHYSECEQEKRVAFHLYGSLNNVERQIEL